MKRYQNLVNSQCLGCDEWLCVTAGAYTGEIVCRQCGVVNVFENSLKPVGMKPCHGKASVQVLTVCVK